jgi:hypothetical protein
MTAATTYYPDGSDMLCCKYWLKTNTGIAVGDTYQTFFDNKLSELSYSVISIEGTNIINTDQPWSDDCSILHSSSRISVPFLVFNGKANPEFGKYAHAEGINTRAMGNSSHAEGKDTQAAHNYSHAGGLGTTTGCEAQTVIGSYNEGRDDTIFEVGNGVGPAAEDRYNAFEIYSDGTAALSRKHVGTGSYINNGTQYPLHIVVSATEPEEKRAGVLWLKI